MEAMDLDPRPFIRRKTPYDVRLLASLARRGVTARGRPLAKLPRDQFPTHTWSEFHWPLDRLDRNDATHLRFAAEDLDGRAIPPGAVFSFWNTVRRPVAVRRFRSTESHYGRVQVVETMDSLSLVASAVYNLALLGGMEIVERHGHTHCPAGPFGEFPRARDAGIEYGFRDLRFKNQRGVQVVLRFDVSDHDVRGALLAAEPCPYDVELQDETQTMSPPTLVLSDPGLRPGEERVILAGAPGYHIETTRNVVFGTGKREWDYPPVTNYEPVDTIIGRGPPLRDAIKNPA